LQPYFIWGHTWITFFIEGHNCSRLYSGTDLPKKLRGYRPCSHIYSGTYFEYSIFSGTYLPKIIIIVVIGRGGAWGDKINRQESKVNLF